MSRPRTLAGCITCQWCQGVELNCPIFRRFHRGQRGQRTLATPSVPPGSIAPGKIPSLICLTCGHTWAERGPSVWHLLREPHSFAEVLYHSSAVQYGSLMAKTLIFLNLNYSGISKKDGKVGESNCHDPSGCRWDWHYDQP